MFWSGLLVGIVVGICLATFFYARLVPRIELLQEFAANHERIVADLQAELEKRAAAIRVLQSDMNVMMKWVPHEATRFFDAPYRQN
jgi:MFS superfamily sulfate permease-like transporter